MQPSFKHTITSTYDTKGKEWLDSLPNLIFQCSKLWQLTKLTVYPNLTYNYVLQGWQNDQPIVLKLRCDEKELIQEVKALQAFQGPACVKVLNYNSELGAILMQQLQPGHDLGTLVEVDDQNATAIAANLFKQLPQATNIEFKHLFQILPDFSQNFELLQKFLPLAAKLKKELLKSDEPYQRLLHGDFHHGNILQNYATWCVIDPEGLWGDVGYDLAIFIRNPLIKLVSLPNAKLLISQRINDLSYLLQYPAARLWQWTFLQAATSAYWSLEDGLEIKNHLDFLHSLTQIKDEFNV